MNKTLKNVIIGIGIAAILAAVYTIINGGKLMDSSGGIVIGAALIGTTFLENTKKK